MIACTSVALAKEGYEGIYQKFCKIKVEWYTMMKGMNFWIFVTSLITILQSYINPLIAYVLPQHSAVLASTIHTKQQSIPTIRIPISPLISFTITPTPIKYSVKPALVDCVGPDHKHLSITQKQCDDFTAAWHLSSPETIAPTSQWGAAKQIAEHTYTITVGTDSRMATASEIVVALNNYRTKKGVGQLTWDDKLGNFAQSRADTFAFAGKLDEHAGFKNYLNTQDGFVKLGYNFIGENASFTGPLLGVHLIEWVFAGDQEHDNNQRNPQWTSVGVGVHSSAVDIVFATQKR